MGKGNKEIRFRADETIHFKVSKLQDEIGTSEKSTACKLLINLGDDKIKEVVNYLDSITHPLNNNQFEDFFLSLKIRVKQKRNDREVRRKAF